MYKIARFNEWLAVRGTLVFGSMWATYLFFMYGFLPLMFPNAMDKLLYWSNTVQLWSLPLLMVGQNVTGRSAEKRAIEMYNMVKEELSIVKEELEVAKAERQELHSLITYLHQRLDEKEAD